MLAWCTSQCSQEEMSLKRLATKNLVPDSSPRCWVRLSCSRRGREGTRLVNTWDWQETSQFWPWWYNFSREPSQTPSCNVFQFLDDKESDGTKHTSDGRQPLDFNLHLRVEVCRSRRTSRSTSLMSRSRRSCRTHRKLLQLLRCFASSGISKQETTLFNGMFSTKRSKQQQNTKKL